MTDRSLRIGVLALALVCALAATARAQHHAPPFPREGVKKAAENEFFAVWDVTFQKGQTTPTYQLPFDQVYVFMNDGAVKFTRGDGTSMIEVVKLGSVRHVTKGTIESETGVSDTPVRAMIFQVKDAIPPKRPVVEGVPDKYAGGRKGVVKLFETDRFTVWDATWLTGMTTPRHLHYHIEASVYIVAGKSQVIGSDRPSEWVPGRVNAGTAGPAEPHSEKQVEGEPRSISIQLKDR